MIKRSTMTGAMLTLLLAGACAAAPDQEPKREQTEKESKLRQSEEKELVEITIRLPDGRVIKRKEPRIASKVETDVPPLTSSAPTAAKRGAQSNKSKGVTVTKRGVTGGTNSSGVNTTGGSGGGGGGGGAGGGSGGGGGGSGSGSGNSTTPPPSGGGGHSGGTNNDQITPVQPDSDSTVRFYAWGNTGDPFQHIQKAILVEPWRGRTPEQLAASVARQARQSPFDKVVLRFWKEFNPAVRDPFDHSNPRELINSRGYTEGLTEYWTEFAFALRDQGIRPDYLIFDQEEGIEYWHLPSSHRREFFSELIDSSRPLPSGLPASMATVDLDDFLLSNAAGRDARRDYSRFAHEFRADLLRRAFVLPFEQAYGDGILASNYWDIIPSDPIYRFYGGEEPAATIDGVSAPVAYIDVIEDGSRYSTRDKHPRWNRFIDILNRLRSTAQPGLTTPWIAPPGYGRNGPDTWSSAANLDDEKWLWEAMMDHMLAMGIDTFILWNPRERFNPNAVDTDNFMDDWLAVHQQAPTLQLRSLDPIPLDSDQIETNGVVTTYDEFMRVMGYDSDE